MTGAILAGAAFLFQADPNLEEVERLTGPFRRPWLWAPLAVTISSASGFRGDVAARSSLGFSCARHVEVAAGGRLRVILPALDPVEVAVGSAVRRLPVERSPARFLAAVDARLPWAAELVSDDRILYRKVGPADLRELLELGLMEAFDLLLLSEAEGMPLGAYGMVGAWRVVRTREEAEEAAAGLGEPPPRFGAVDTEPHRLMDLAPREGWVPAQKGHAVFFCVLYAFAGFAALVGASRRGPRAAPAAAAGVALLFAGIYALFFPRGRLWVVEYSCEAASAEGAAGEWRVWFAGSGAGVETGIRFPRLVKPLFARSSGADDPFTIRLEGLGCRVEGLRIPPGGVQGFVSGGDRTPTMRPGPALAAPLYRAVLARGGRFRSVGDLAAGAMVPGEGGREVGLSEDPEIAALAARFTSGGALVGRLEPSERTVRDVVSPDLADARGRPRLWVGVLK